VGLNCVSTIYVGIEALENVYSNMDNKVIII
jgi:hypothetical protein